MNNGPTNTVIANLDGHTSVEEHEMKVVLCLEAANPNKIANAIRLLTTKLDENGVNSQMMSFAQNVLRACAQKETNEVLVS